MHYNFLLRVVTEPVITKFFPFGGRTMTIIEFALRAILPYFFLPFGYSPQVFLNSNLIAYIFLDQTLQKQVFQLCFAVIYAAALFLVSKLQYVVVIH